MIDINQETGVIAVGRSHVAAESGQKSGSNEVVALYSLSNGQKKKSLCLGQVFLEIANQLRPNAGQNLSIGALTVRRDGDVLAALCPDVSTLCVWDLRTSWQSRLISRQAAALEPVKTHQVSSIGGSRIRNVVSR